MSEEIDVKRFETLLLKHGKFSQLQKRITRLEIENARLSKLVETYRKKCALEGMSSRVGNESGHIDADIEIETWVASHATVTPTQVERRG